MVLTIINDKYSICCFIFVIWDAQTLPRPACVDSLSELLARAQPEPPPPPPFHNNLYGYKSIHVVYKLTTVSAIKMVTFCM